jgi:excisionase family DNA binding protein
MTLPIYLGTAEVADALGVSVSTVKRWVDEGILPAHKTAGGHRKLLVNDVVRLVRGGGFPRLNWERLLGQAELAARSRIADVPADALLTALERGDGPAVAGVLRRCREQGMSFAELGDEVVAPAMHRIGLGWEHGRLDVLHEHRATQMVAAALYDLKNRAERRGDQERPGAVVAAVEGDPSVLPCLLVHLVLTEEGWDATLVGPNTPTDSLVKALRELRPKLLCLSVSYLDDPEALAAGWGQVYQTAQETGTALAVGGRALSDQVRQQLRFHFHGDRLAQLADFVRLLLPSPKRPRRGRPPADA